LHQDANWTVAASTWFLGMWFDLFTFAVPQNVGSLEGSRIFIMKLLGFTQFDLLGMTYGFALRLTMTFWSCFGLVIYGFLISGSGNGEKRKNRHKSPAIEKQMDDARSDSKHPSSKTQVPEKFQAPTSNGR
jgi:hypothetical protein